MTTPSGQISLSDVRLEIYGSATGQIDMQNSNVYKLAGKTVGSTISMSNLKSKTWLKLSDISVINPNSPVTGSTLGWMNSSGSITLTKTGTFAATASLNGGASVTITTGGTPMSVSSGDTLEIDVSATLGPSGSSIGHIDITGAMSITVNVDLERS